jgi:hypothetical protein
VARDADREWRLVTVPFWRADALIRDHVLLGEVPLRTDLLRRVDGVAVKRVGRGGPVPGPFYLSGRATPAVERRHWLSQIPGSTVIAIQTKVEPVGFSVLGQTLVSTELLPELYPDCRATGIALGTAGDPDLERILPAVSRKLRIAGWPVEGAKNRPTREYPVAARLLDQLGAKVHGLKQVPKKVLLTRHESAEALFVSGSSTVRSPDELRGRDVVAVHTIGKATNLPVVGHAVFSAALIREHRPRSLRSIVVAAGKDGVVERVATAFDIEILHAT